MLKRFAPLIILLAGLLLIGAGLVYRQVMNGAENPAPAPIPETVLGLSQVRASYGADAIAEVSQMHNQSFPLTSGAVAMYGQTGEMVTLWVTGAPMGFLAERMVLEMEAAIANGESPFTPLGVRQIDGRDVYELTGMGQTHYYYRSAELVVWLAADAAIAEDALAETMIFYP